MLLQERPIQAAFVFNKRSHDVQGEAIDRRHTRRVTHQGQYFRSTIEGE